MEVGNPVDSVIADVVVVCVFSWNVRLVLGVVKVIVTPAAGLPRLSSAATLSPQTRSGAVA